MRIAKIALQTRDIERMQTFYMTYFGASVCGQRIEPKTGIRTCCLAFQDGTEMKLIHRPDRLWETGRNPGKYTTALIFSAGGREAVNELTLRLGDAGYEILAGPFETEEAVYESCVLDPEENQIEITE